MQACKVSPYIRNGCPNRRVIGRVIYLLPKAVAGPIRVSIILLQYTYNLSMSARQSKKGVSAFTIWKLTRPIGVLTATDPINVVKPILNQTFIAPVCVVSISILLFVVALYTRYYLQPAVDFFKAPVLIITLQNSLGVQHSIVIYANGSYLWSVTSVTGVLIDWFSGVIKYINKRSVNTVIILKAQLSIKGLKVVRNVFKVSCSQASKLKSIIRASIDLSRDSSASSPLYSKINWLIYLSNLLLDLLYFS